jgi:PilZ domain-containing protein
MMTSSDRRWGYRLPLEMYLNTYVEDRATRGFTSNLSATGLYLNTLSREPLAAGTPVGLEFNLPGISETIWAAGEMCYDAPDDYFNGSGIRFKAMAGLHERLIRAYLKEARRQRWLSPRRPLT